MFFYSSCKVMFLLNPQDLALQTFPISTFFLLLTVLDFVVILSIYTDLHIVLGLGIFVAQQNNRLHVCRHRLGNTFSQSRYRLMSTFFQLHFHSIALPYSAPFMTPFSLSDLLCSLLSHSLPLMSDCT